MMKPKTPITPTLAMILSINKFHHLSQKLMLSKRGISLLEMPVWLVRQTRNRLRESGKRTKLSGKRKSFGAQNPSGTSAHADSTSFSSARLACISPRNSPMQKATLKYTSTLKCHTSNATSAMPLSHCKATETGT